MSTNVPATSAPVPAPAAPTAVAEPRKLDDVLLAMDVVDTLRHREKIVDAELDADARENQLIERLKQIYDAQGIQVPERILKDGVKALEEQRFVYKAPAPSFNVSLAKLYINRKRWGVPVIAVIVLGLLAGTGGWFYQQKEAADWQRLPAVIAQLEKQATALAVDPQVDARIAAIAREGQRAVAAHDHGDAEAQVKALQDINGELADEYDLRIVSRPGEDSGFYRIPDSQPNGRNYYLVVEPVAPGGRVLTVPVKNEETQKVQRVSKWAQRVTQDEFNKVAADKRNDQIIQDDILGTKARGELEPKLIEGVSNGAITSW